MEEATILALKDIQAALEAGRNVESLDELTGRILAEFVDRYKPWGRSQINAVKNGKQPAPPELAHAIMAFAYSMDGVDPLRAQAVKVECHAVGNVKPGSLILADSRVCAYPPCSMPFVPKVPNQNYHSPDCRRENYRHKRKANQNDNPNQRS